jgi:hypothetical protein
MVAASSQRREQYHTAIRARFFGVNRRDAAKSIPQSNRQDHRPAHAGELKTQQVGGGVIGGCSEDLKNRTQMITLNAMLR